LKGPLKKCQSLRDHISAAVMTPCPILAAWVGTIFATQNEWSRHFGMSQHGNVNRAAPP
jgi:hypothetical protein